MKRRALLASATAVMAFVVLAGCTKSTPASTTTTTSSSSKRLLAGKITGPGWTRVSIHNASTGEQITNTIADGNGAYSFSLPPGACPSGGYKVSFEGAEGFQGIWYDAKTNPGAADCVDLRAGDATSINGTLLPAVQTEGYVKDASTAADINGATVNAYDAKTGEQVATTSSGMTASGRWGLYLSPTARYKFKVEPPPSYQEQWFSGAADSSSATDTAAGTAINFSIKASGK